ncbi:MAG: AraC family transcriptional regulator [Planctomycetota bacterium]|jgi:AraC-like DNA-binding protein
MQLDLKVAPLVSPAHGGLFISRGRGIHPDRTIDSFELILVRSGRLGMGEEDRRFDLSAGDTLLLWPGRRHYGTEAYPEDLSFFWVHFRLPRRKRRTAGQVLRVPQTARPSRPDRLAELYSRYLDDQESGTRDELTSALTIGLMLAEVCRAAPPPGAGVSAALAARADAFVRTHFHEPISTGLVARELDCNPDYLGRVFRRTFGFGLTEAIHRRRLVHARRLLLESTANIAEVAREVGFEDPGYFRRVFRRREGVSPRAFRKIHARMHVNTE